jgi:flagellar hook protein FlgE
LETGLSSFRTQEFFSDTDLARDSVNQILSHRSFTANLKVVETLDEMAGTLLDILG